MKKMGNQLWYLFLLLLSGTIAAVHVAADEPVQGEVFTLGEIVVSEEDVAVNAATTVTEISMEQISAKGAKTIGDALRFLPGVYVRNAGKGETHVSIRGFEQRQVKVLIDGVPARESYFGTVDLSMLAADSVSKITVTKGASSALYGANTMGGVINIITKKGGNTPQTSLSASFGDYGTADYFLNHGSAVGNLNYWVSAGFQTSDGFRLSGDFDTNDSDVGLGTQYNEDGGKRDLSYYDKKNLDIKVGYDPGGDSSVYLSFDHVDNERGMPTFYNRYWEYYKWKQWQINLVGEHRFSQVFKAKARLFYVDHEDGIKDVSWDADHTTSGRKWLEKSYYDDSSTGGEIQAAIDFVRWNTLRLGLHYLEDSHKEADYLTNDCWDVIQGRASVGWTDEEEYAAHTYTIAVEDEVRPTDRLAVVIGLNYDVFEPTKTADQPEPGQMNTVNPQFGIVYNLTNATSLHASVGQKTRFPSLKELYSTYGGGNPDLDPERAIVYEIGASHSFSDKASAGLSVFYHDVDELIDTTRLNNNTVYINVNEATIYGAEATIKLRLSEAFDADVNYTYLGTEDKSHDDRELEGRPRQRYNMTFTYRFPFGLTANMHGCYTQQQYWLNGDNEWAELPDYFLVNAKLTQRLPSVGVIQPEIFLQGINILDEDYYETSGPEPGFNLLAGVTLRM